MGETMNATLARRARFVVGLMLIGAVGCAKPLQQPPDTGPIKGDYVIGVSDSLLINVWKNPELSLTVPVRNDGKISVPLLDDIQADGLTPMELKEVITTRLEEFITAPDVTVVVLDQTSKSASIIGAVGRSGMVALHRDTRVLDAIATMGGFSTWARKSRVKVLRRTPDGLAEYGFDYDAYIDGDAPGSNFLLKPGDTIVVPD